MDERKQIFKDSTQYLVSTVLAQGVGLFRSLVLPVLLGPAQLGIWNLMNVVIGYGANVHLGILHGLNKKVPMLRGLGNAREFDELKDSVYWASLSSSRSTHPHFALFRLLSCCRWSSFFIFACYAEITVSIW